MRPTGVKETEALFTGLTNRNNQNINIKRIAAVAVAIPLAALCPHHRVGKREITEAKGKAKSNLFAEVLMQMAPSKPNGPMCHRAKQIGQF